MTLLPLTALACFIDSSSAAENGATEKDMRVCMSSWVARAPVIPHAAASKYEPIRDSTPLLKSTVHFSRFETEGEAIFLNDFFLKCFFFFLSL